MSRRKLDEVLGKYFPQDRIDEINDMEIKVDDLQDIEANRPQISFEVTDEGIDFETRVHIKFTPKVLILLGVVIALILVTLATVWNNPDILVELLTKLTQ